MNLLEIRKWFINDSGRFDLVKDLDTYEDNGANKYIQAGQKFLDRLVSYRSQFARVFRQISYGDYFVRFQNSRTIERVYVNTVDEKFELTRLDYAELKEMFPQRHDLVETGQPKYWAPAYLRMNQFDDDPRTEGHVGFMDVMPDWKEYNGVVFFPRADGAYGVEVQGKFFAESLLTDDDTSFWSVNEPSVLVKAAMREIEVFYRNTQGVNDWERAIISELYGMEKDFVDDTYGHINQMEG